MQISWSRFFNRSLWRKCHVSLALLLGLIFAVIGLTGSLSVYRESIDTWLNPSLTVTSNDAAPLSLDKILAAVRNAHPDRHGAWTLELPRNQDQMITVWFEKPRESVDEFYAPLMVSVNPYTAEVVTSRFWGQTLTTWLLDWHTHLQMGADGRNDLAILAVLLTITVISGLALWWTGLSTWRQAWQLRHDAGLMRLLLDLHRLLGVISAPALLLLAFTGFHLAYPDLLEKLTAAEGMGHGDSGPTIRSTGVPNAHPVNISEAVVVARGLFPSSEVRRITTPVGDLGTYRVNLRQKQELNQHHPFTTVWVDRWSGQIRSVSNPSKFSAGQIFTTWQWPLHTGEALGNWGRWLWFVAGLTPALLLISGLLCWLYRQRWLVDRPVDIRRWRHSWRKRYRRIAADSELLFWRHGYPALSRLLKWLRHQLNARKR